MEREIQLSNLLDRLYLSVHRPSLQVRAVQDIASWLGAESIAFALHDQNGEPVFTFPHSVLHRQKTESPTQTNDAHPDNLSIKIGVDRRLLSNGLAEGQGSGSGPDLSERKLFLVLTFVGTGIDEADTETLLEPFVMMSRHLSRALLLSYVLELELSVKQSLIDAVGRGRQTLIVVDEGLNVRFFAPDLDNEPSSITEEAVHIANGRLVIVHKSDEKRIRQAVCRCIYRKPRESGDFLLEKDPRIQVRVLPNGRDGDQSATILLKRKQDRLRLCDRTLRRLCGLSQREIDFITVFVEFPNLPLVSQHLNISYETTRWHLKRVMTKLEVKSQAELLSYVVSSCLLTD